MGELGIVGGGGCGSRIGVRGWDECTRQLVGVRSVLPKPCSLREVEDSWDD